MMNKVFTGVLIVGALMLAACGASPTPSSADKPGKTVSVDGGTYTDITVPELESMFEDKIQEAPLWCVVPLVITAILSVGLFFFPQPFFNLASLAVQTIIGG